MYVRCAASPPPLLAATHCRHPPLQIDNLNATIDLKLLFHIVTRGVNFAMEVTARTRQDVQGGTLIGYEGKPRLLEASQVPPEHADAFKSLKSFGAWCTNNLWVNLKEIKAALASGALRSPVIVNERNVPLPIGGAAAADAAADAAPGGGGGGGGGIVPVLELETAAGAAIEFFPHAIGIVVPRMRFLPVKNTADLFAVQSNLFDVRHGVLHLSAARSSPSLPVIRLGPEFASLEQFERRVRAGGATPCILEADHISITGDVHFGRGVVLRGSVVVVAAEGSRIDIPPKSELENVVVTGSLRLLGT